MLMRLVSECVVEYRGVLERTLSFTRTGNVTPSYLLMCPHWKLWRISMMLRYVIPLDHEQRSTC